MAARAAPACAAIEMQASRNDPCPCGSGRRFKQCCGALPGMAPAARAAAPAAPAAAPAPLREPDVQSLAALIGRGRLAEAESQAELLLRRHPE
ncbi:MAG: SEC-C domain-containing protein, partial [Gammaproteobacteria bacterium]|nr:SEC-C domain-containing protein [Gammaproteobacteria bacterium]